MMNDGHPRILALLLVLLVGRAASSGGGHHDDHAHEPPPSSPPPKPPPPPSPPSVFINVSPSDDLMTALAAVPSGGELVLADGTYTPTADANNALIVGKDVTVRAANTGFAIIDGQNVRHLDRLDPIGMLRARQAAAAHKRAAASKSMGVHRQVTRSTTAVNLLQAKRDDGHASRRDFMGALRSKRAVAAGGGAGVRSSAEAPSSTRSGMYTPGPAAACTSTLGLGSRSARMLRRLRPRPAEVPVSPMKD